MISPTGLNINVIAAPTDSDTRQQKITTILSTGDSSVDIIEINDEMSSAFKNSGWLEGLNDTVMTEDIIDYFAKGYVENTITDNEGNIIGVPGYTGYLAFWVNQEIMDEAGIILTGLWRRTKKRSSSSMIWFRMDRLLLTRSQTSTSR